MTPPITLYSYFSSQKSYLSNKTAVKPSPIHGKGLFAIAPIRKHEIFCIKGGHIEIQVDHPKTNSAAGRLGCLGRYINVG